MALRASMVWLGCRLEAQRDCSSNLATPSVIGLALKPNKFYERGQSNAKEHMQPSKRLMVCLRYGSHLEAVDHREMTV